MRRYPVTSFILVAVVIGVVGAWLLFAKNEHDRFVAVQQVRHSRSEFSLTYTVDHTSGPVAREQWSMHNVEGHSTASYAVTDRKGTTARFDEPVAGYDVTFLFDSLVQHGVWELQSRPFRGSPAVIHVVRIQQTYGTQSGSHRFSFSDAKYIATSAGREYHIHLDPNKPVPNVLALSSTSTADPRYGQIVDLFANFGSPSFKKTILAAREKLLKS